MARFAIMTAPDGRKLALNKDAVESAQRYDGPDDNSAINVQLTMRSGEKFVVTGNPNAILALLEAP